MKIVIIDHNNGNCRSLKNAVDFLGYKCKISSNFTEISDADKIFLPGVGSFATAIKIIKQKKIDIAIKNSLKKNSHILGICLGMQLLCSSGFEDGCTVGLGYFKGKIKILNNKNLKIPHIGFNNIIQNNCKILFKNIKPFSDFYFNHSYCLLKNNKITNYAITKYENKFISAIEKKNIFGTQFHPENSQSNGLILIKNFLEFKEC